MTGFCIFAVSVVLHWVVRLDAAGFSSRSSYYAVKAKLQ